MSVTSGNESAPTPLDKVRAELERYEHRLMEFGARERADGTIMLQIAIRNRPPDIHLYEAPLHPRDISTDQFAWTFQRLLYDCIHDYVVELFTRTPQSQDATS